MDPPGGGGAKLYCMQADGQWRFRKFIIMIIARCKEDVKWFEKLLGNAKIYSML